MDHKHHMDHAGDDDSGHDHGTMKMEMGKGKHKGHAMPAGENHHRMMLADYRKRFWISLILTAPILTLSPAIQKFLGLRAALSFPGDIYLLLTLSTIVYVYGGSPFLKGIVEELGSRQPGMMTLIAVAITVAFAYSAAVALGISGKLFFWELVTLIDIMLLGHWIEMRSILGASRALEELVKLMPSEAHRLREDGATEDVPVADLAKGNRVIVKPGEKFPTDGEIVEGETSVNESMLTGESKPVDKKAGDQVIGGSINGQGSVTMVVQKTGGETFLSQIVEMVREAQESKSKAQALADRAAFFLVIIALSVGFLTLVGWLSFGKGAEYAIERMATVMVITCPHALGLAVPLVIAVITAIGAKQGLLVRNRTAFEQARDLNAVVFDKTGTLTEGQFGVVAVAPWEGDEREILRLAAAVESRSEHPIAQGIVRSAKEKGIALPRVEGFSAIRGKGAQAKVEGSTVVVASPGYLRERGITTPDRSSKLSAGGRTIVYVIREGKPIGAIALADVVRPESREAIARLKEMGLRCMMLTGDNEEVAKMVADELDLDEYFAEVLPGEKSEKIAEIQGRGLKVAMTGDGINDAPALAKADVGIAIGAGTDVAVETADIVLVKNNPKDVVNLVELSRVSYRKMMQNLVWATGYNVVAIPLAAGVLASAGIILSPAMGAVLMSASTVIVAINARLIRAPGTA